jgi:hypothetical protein
VGADRLGDSGEALANLRGSPHASLNIGAPRRMLRRLVLRGSRYRLVSEGQALRQARPQGVCGWIDLSEGRRQG